MVHGNGDGLKNYFTLQSYLTQPDQDGYLWFSGMQYPYGESIWYTDNSPLIAMILRFVQLNLFDIAPYSVMIFNWIILLNLLLAPFVLIRLLRRIIQSEWLVIIGALVCIWTSPQFLRFFTGNLNLSISIFYFLAILLVLNILQAIAGSERRAIRKYSVQLCLLIIAASFVHLYYLLLLGLPVGVTLFIHGLACARDKRVRKSGYVIPVFAVMVAALFVFIIFQLTDPNIAQRTGPPDGSHIPAWEMRFFHLYKAREGVNPIPFLGGKMQFDAENGNYLGGFFWYGVVAVMVCSIALFRRSTAVRLRVTRNMWVMLLSACVVFFASAGLHIYSSGRNVLMDNYLNPLYYIEKVYPPVVHFRCIARMGWWVFYVAQFGLLILLDRYVRSLSPRLFAGVVTVISLVAVSDMYGYYRFAMHEFWENSFAQKSLKRIPELPFQEYQAILPIPYYNVGSEDYSLTIDDSDSWSKYTFQLQLASRLPLMSVKLSRTPPAYAAQYIDLFLKETIDPAMLQAMQNKPVLVVYDSSKEAYATQYPAKAAVENAPMLIQREGMQEVWRSGTCVYYAWQIR